MMTPKEKALQLLSKYTGASLKLSTLDTIVDGIRVRLAKDSVLILVDEILNNDNQFIQTEEQYKYWEAVKQEIKKL